MGKGTVMLYIGLRAVYVLSLVCALIGMFFGWDMQVVTNLLVAIVIKQQIEDFEGW